MWAYFVKLLMLEVNKTPNSELNKLRQKSKYTYLGSGGVRLHKKYCQHQLQK